RDIGHVVNRRTWRNAVNLLGYGVGCFPGPRGLGGHEPHALEAQVVEVADLDHLLLAVGGVLERGAFNRVEPRRSSVVHFDLRSGFSLVDDGSRRDLREQHRVSSLDGSGTEARTAAFGEFGGTLAKSAGRSLPA